MITASKEKQFLTPNRAEVLGFSIAPEKQKLVDGDEIFDKIFKAIGDGWSKLNSAEKEKIKDGLEELIEKLQDYNRAYTVLKNTSGRRADPENYINIKDYQANVKAADEMEKRLHDSFIDAINMLSRQMKKMGLDNSWRGDEKIYGLTPQAMRDKTRNWMFKIFREKF